MRCDVRGVARRYYDLRLFEAQRLGVAAWVTETGSDQQLQLADQYMLTWMHWDYKWYRWVQGDTRRGYAA